MGLRSKAPVRRRTTGVAPASLCVAQSMRGDRDPLPKERVNHRCGPEPRGRTTNPSPFYRALARPAALLLWASGSGLSTPTFASQSALKRVRAERLGTACVQCAYISPSLYPPWPRHARDAQPRQRRQPAKTRDGLEQRHSSMRRPLRMLSPLPKEGTEQPDVLAVGGQDREFSLRSSMSSQTQPHARLFLEAAQIQAPFRSTSCISPHS
jgi:hypothetical protein